MEIRHDYKNNIYFIKEKIGNQTYRMDFNIYDESADTAYINIALYVYTKRKTIEADMDSKAITGTNPAALLRFAKNAYEMLEEKVNADRYYIDRVYSVVATNSRRLHVYERFLSRYGYSHYKKNCLFKKVKANG